MGTTPGLVRPFIQANTVDGGTVQQDGQIIGLNDGGYVIVYNDQSPTFTSGQTVVGQRFDAAGNKLGAELRVSQFDDGQDSVFNGSSITNLHNGNIAFAYTDLFQGDNDVWVRVLNPALGVVRDDAIDTGTAQTKNASITSFADGSYAVSYTLDNGGGNTDIMARIVSATGVVGAPITVRDNGAAGADFSQLVTLSNNTFVDVYQQKVGLTQDIGLAIYTSAGVLVTQHSVFGADGIVSVDETDPDVAALTGGGFVVAWTDSQGDDNVGGQGPRMSIYDNAGHLVAGDIQIHTSTYLAQNEVSLVALQDGGFVATWEDDAYVMVRGQRFDAMGEKIGAEFVVKENNFQPVDTQDIALLADGRFAFALGNLSGGDSDVTTSIWSPTSNDAPAITSDGGGWLANLFVAENSTAVTTVTASDPDGPSAPSFAILTGADSPDAAKFSINAATGVLTFVAAPDFEQPSDSDHDNTYVVQVGASDGNLSGIQTIDVYVTDVAPVITGTNGPDNLNGTAENDTIEGLGGDDSIAGAAGADTLFGGAGSDTLQGGDGNDVLVGNAGGADIFVQSHDVFDGGPGDDTIYAMAGDSIIGGSGHDVLQLVNSYDMSLDLAAVSIEYVVSGFGNDSYTAASGASAVEVYGGGGNDQITGGSGDDRLWGGVGNDTLVGNDGNDVLVGDLGADSLSGGAGNDRLYVGSEDTFIDGGDGFDAAYIATGSGIALNLAATHLEWVADFVGGNDAIDGSGMSVNLEVYAAGGNDTVVGGSGADFLWGGSGDDIVTGNNGNDTLVGGIGSDRLTGGAGTDALYGNSGNGGDGASDTFVFGDNWGTDFVFDFEPGVDKLDLSAVTGLTSFSQLTLVNTADGHCSISFAGNLIAVANMAGHLTQNDFLV